MAEYYSSGDITLCPGNFIESFGLVPLESVANLTPVLCSSVGSLRNYKNISGIEIIPYADVKEFVRKGELLLKNKNKVIEGKEQILKKFSLDKMIEKYISAITSPNKETNENVSFEYKLEFNNETGVVTKKSQDPNNILTTDDKYRYTIAKKFLLIGASPLLIYLTISCIIISVLWVIIGEFLKIDPLVYL